MTATPPRLPGPLLDNAALCPTSATAAGTASHAARCARQAERRGERGSTSALELMALTPMCALLVAFITWAGNTGQAQLAVTLAAQEAATAAAVCCSAAPAASDEPPGTSSDQHTDSPSGEPSAAYDPDTARQLIAEAVISARPSLERLCLRGPQPGAAHGRWTTRTTAPAATDRPSAGLAVATAHVSCTADGNATPLRGLFGARTVHGHGTHIARAHTPDASSQPTEPRTGDTP